MIVHIIIDASGSMIEDSKNGIIKYMLTGMKHIHARNSTSNTEYKVYQWGRKTAYLGTLADYEKVLYEGNVTEEGVNILLDLIPKEDTILLLSDGNISEKEGALLKSAFENIFSIAVGADADLYSLEDICNRARVYYPIDYIKIMSLLG